MLWRPFALGVAALVASACGGEEFSRDDGSGSTTGGAGGGATASASNASSGATSSATTSSGTGGATFVEVAIVQVTDTEIVSNEDVPSISLATLPSAGNAIIVGVTCFSEVDNCTIPPGGVADNQGNAYQLVIEGDSIVSSVTHGARGHIFLAEGIGSPSGEFAITVDPNGSYPPSYQNFAWGALEVAGLVSGSLDRTGSVPSSCCEPSTTVATSMPTSQANELAVAIHTGRSNDDDVAYGHDPTWTEHHVNPNGVAAGMPHSLVTKVLSSTGVVEHTWTHDPPTRGVSAIVATFKGHPGP